MTNLAAANVSMDLITGVTGHTNEVARENYLLVDCETQLATARKLAAICWIEGVVRPASEGGPSARAAIESEAKKAIRSEEGVAEEPAAAAQNKTALKPTAHPLPSGAKEPRLSIQDNALSIQDAQLSPPESGCLSIQITRDEAELFLEIRDGEIRHINNSGANSGTNSVFKF